MKPPVIQNPIRMTAVIVVAVISIYAMYMTWWMTDVLAGEGWCRKAIGADKLVGGSGIDISASCVGLLTIQLKTLGTNSHIFTGMFALVLLVLIVIVIAGGKLSVDASKTGIHANIGRDAPEVAAAKEVAAAAEGKAEEIAATAPVAEVIPEYAR